MPQKPHRLNNSGNAGAQGVQPPADQQENVQAQATVQAQTTTVITTKQLTVKISELPPVASITDDTIIPVVVSGSNYKTTAADLAAYVDSGSGSQGNQGPQGAQGIEGAQG